MNLIIFLTLVKQTPGICTGLPRLGMSGHPLSLFSYGSFVKGQLIPRASVYFDRIPLGKFPL